MVTRVDPEEHLGPVHYSDLRAHLGRDAVFVVRAPLTLLEAARGLARDDAAAVKAWLEAGTLRRPTDDERDAWAATPDRTFVAVPVQPFVLVEEPATN